MRSLAEVVEILNNMFLMIFSTLISINLSDLLGFKN